MSGSTKVSRSDIETKLRLIDDELRGLRRKVPDETKPVSLATLGLVLAAAAYLLGVRRARRRSAVIEIKKV